MTALLLIALLSVASSADAPAGPEAGPSEHPPYPGGPNPPESSEGPREGPVEAPDSSPTPPESGPEPAPEPEPGLEFGDEPSGTTPPDETGGPEIPTGDPSDAYTGEVEPDPEPEPNLDPEGYEFEERSFEDMPYAATAARKSAVSRHNDVLVRPFRKPVYTIAAAGRFATSLIGGRDVIQPFGFGVAAQLRIHFLRVLKSRFGVEIYAGYTRFPERVQYSPVEGVSAQITRLNLLANTDVSAGPSLQIPIGPVFVQFGASAGVAFSTLTRTQSVEAIDDELVVSTDPLIRGGISLGLPIYSRHGLTVGTGVQHIFSREQVALDLADPEGPTTQPFATWLEVNLGYQMWF